MEQVELEYEITARTLVNSEVPDDCREIHYAMIRYLEASRVSQRTFDQKRSVSAIEETAKRAFELLVDALDELDQAEFGYTPDDSSRCCPMLVLESGDINQRYCVTHGEKGIGLREREVQVRFCLTNHRDCPEFPKSRDELEEALKIKRLFADVDFQSVLPSSLERWEIGQWYVRTKVDLEYRDAFVNKIMAAIWSIEYEEGCVIPHPQKRPLLSPQDLEQFFLDLVARWRYVETLLGDYRPRTPRIERFEDVCRQLIRARIAILERILGLGDMLPNERQKEVYTLASEALRMRRELMEAKHELHIVSSESMSLLSEPEQDSPRRP